MSAKKLLIIICLPALLCASCRKFLDVSPDNQILQEDLFENNEGVRVAVNGVYKAMSTTELYGKNLSWGFASAISNNYELYALPYYLWDATQYKWNTSTSEQITEQVWKKAFNVLANVNNIIQQVAQKDTLFFPEKTNEKNMILGEMHGLRAMLHFEMLRIFSPAPVTGYAGETIPYVSAYPTYQPARLPMTTLFDKMIADLKLAQNYLGYVDTVYLRNVMRSGTGRIRSNSSWVTLPQGDFFNFRAQRMNYFAATGLLARIYMYKGDYENARNSAQVVYDYQKKNWFQWTNAIYQGQITDVDYIYTKRPDELMLCFSNGNNYTIYEKEIFDGGGAGSVNYMMNDAYIQKLFEGDMDDYRIVGWYNRYNDMRYLTWTRPKGTSYYAEQVLKDQGPLLPVMRFTEMYHILIECLSRQGRIAEAVTMLNDLRLRRGAKVKIATTITHNELMNFLVKDIVRETLTEGQAFYTFKRLNRNIFNGETDRVMQPNEWFAPLPQSEIAYQL
jgi:starch-binding outer membrane protein, SusD/RagB family